jgi:hypothetical protein
MRDFINIMAIIIAVVLAVFLLIAPLAYLDGKARSEVIKYSTGLEMPWYRAVYINTDSMLINANIKIKAEKL